MAHHTHKPPRAGIARRLTLAFALLLSMFGVASYFAFKGLVELHESFHDEILRTVDLAQQRADRLVGLREISISGLEQHADAAQHTVVRRMLILLVASILCAAGVGIYVYRSIARPIAALASGTDTVASGNLDMRIEITSDDELGRLAERFNGMTAALKEHQAKLVQTEKLAGIGRLAAGVAHEINNPLAVILGYVKLLRRKAEPSLDADLKIVQDEAERCQEVVEDLLDLTRPPRLETDTVDLRALCDEVIGRLTTASGPGPQLTVTGGAAVIGSSRRIRQVVVNLVRNAVEAAGAAGAVRIDIAKAAPAQVVLIVSDTGPGIAPGHRGQLFEPFFTTKPSGTGLGLAVSRAIARAHGGDLDLDQRSAQGAAFRLTLPAEKERAA